MVECVQNHGIDTMLVDEIGCDYEAEGRSDRPAERRETVDLRARRLARVGCE
jgi:hypothetical protein